MEYICSVRDWMFSTYMMLELPFSSPTGEAARDDTADFSGSCNDTDSAKDKADGRDTRHFATLMYAGRPQASERGVHARF